MTFHLSIVVVALLIAVWFFSIRSLRAWRAELENARSDLATRYAEKEQLEAKMRSYIDDVRAAHERAMRAAGHAEQANMAKSEFLANMSHELRTPMNGIIGMTHMLENTVLDTEQREFNDVIARSANSLLLIVNDILDLSKIEAGNMALEIKPFALHKAIVQTIELFVPLASEKGLLLQWELSADLPHFVEGDETRIIQILRNLLGNAIKFTDQGSVRLIVTQTEKGVHFEIHDTGIGIPDDQTKKVFEKFHQANNSSTRRFGGTGLGLAISRELVELMRGQIGLESKIGQGSVFWFTVSLKARPDISEAVERYGPGSKEALGESAASINTDARILMAEDHPANQFLMKKLLSKMGFAHIDLSENGCEAVEKFKPGAYDVILMDGQMPEMDGYEATRRIRAMEEGSGHHVIIIAMTANAMIGDREKCISAGMDDYVSKPVEARKFKSLLAQWIPGERSVHDSHPSHEPSLQSKRMIVNTDHLESFTEGDPVIERELFGIFEEQAVLAFSSLEKACNDVNECESWQKSAHRFKGAAANLGAEILAKICLKAEKIFQEKENLKQDCLTEMRTAYDEVQKFIKDRIGE